LSLSIVVHGQTNNTITFTLSAITCNGINQKIGDSCKFKLNIAIPAGNSTTMYLEIFPSDLNTSYAQLCRPAITYNSTKLTFNLPQPIMLSDYLSKSQVRQIFLFSIILNLYSIFTLWNRMWVQRTFLK